ncbi:hypothetical protein C8R45DRAFT_1086574 [Mycena sanguinolenta]|nr:hypothetical protein C8R45DRAFT_1086574 [Mycena sanguinolenta]
MTASTAAELRTRLAEMDAEIIQQNEILKKICGRMIVQSQFDSLVYPVLTLPIENIHPLPAPRRRKSRAHERSVCTFANMQAMAGDRTDHAEVMGDLGCQCVDKFGCRLSRARHNPLSVTLRHQPEKYYHLYGLADGGKLYDFPDLTPGSFPRLKRLLIGPAISGSLAFFADAPKLRELVLSGLLFIPASDISLPLQQLTFSGHNFALDDFLDILRSAPDLERCNISLRFDGSEGNNWPGNDILKSVTLPALHTLDVSQIAGLTQNNLENFLIRSSAPLRQLAVARDCEDDFTSWEGCLRLMPSLEDFQLHCRESNFRGGFLNALSRSQNRLLPNLRRFLIRGNVDPDVERYRVVLVYTQL